METGGDDMGILRQRASSWWIVLACIVWLASAAGCGSSATDTIGDTGDSGTTPDADDSFQPNPATDFRDYSFEEPVVSGNTFYIDPVNGADDGDGSAGRPWRTLQQVIADGLIEHYRHSESRNPDSPLTVVNEGAPVKGGDRLLLRSGYHGFVAVNTFIFNDWLTIAAQEGHTPVLSQIKMVGAFEKIYLKHLTILKSSYDGADDYWTADDITHNTDACLYLGTDTFWGRGSQVKVNGLVLGTTTDTSSWTAADWIEKAAGGISLRTVTDCEIVNCHIENVRHGLAIEYASDGTIAVNNTIKYYSGDGCRLISNNVFLAYNTITDCLDVGDGNHDDAIQSYSRGEDGSPGTGVLYNNVVRGNLIIGTTDFGHPLAGNPQGIGCFDGFFDGWTVENNIVVVDHYHGISFYGMRNSRILNNTVIDQNYDNDMSPWIHIVPHKDGTPSENCILANNIVYRDLGAEGHEMTVSNNYVIGRNNSALLYDLFVAPDNFDFHLQDNSVTREHLIDQGEIFGDQVSSEMDQENSTRTGAPDLGALESGSE